MKFNFFAVFIMFYCVLHIHVGQSQVSAGMLDSISSTLQIEPKPKDLEEHILDAASSTLDLVPSVLKPMTLPLSTVVETRRK